MPEENCFITSECRVTLHYSLTLSDGTEVVSTFDDTPLLFHLGDGTMVEALEQSLIGLTCGSEGKILLSGDDAFGSRSDEKIQHMPRNEFPDELAITLGQVIAFTTPGGDEVAGQILEINQDDVLVDFNHPLSGHFITFRVKILDIDPQPEVYNRGN